MSDAFERATAQMLEITRKVDAAIEGSAGKRLKFTLIVWSDEQTYPNLDYAHASSLSTGMLPDLLRRIADRFEHKPVSKNTRQ